VTAGEGDVLVVGDRPRSGAKRWVWYSHEATVRVRATTASYRERLADRAERFDVDLRSGLGRPTSRSDVLLLPAQHSPGAHDLGDAPSSRRRHVGRLTGVSPYPRLERGTGDGEEITRAYVVSTHDETVTFDLEISGETSAKSPRFSLHEADESNFDGGLERSMAFTPETGKGDLADRVVAYRFDPDRTEEIRSRGATFELERTEDRVVDPPVYATLGMIEDRLFKILFVDQGEPNRQFARHRTVGTAVGEEHELHPAIEGGKFYPIEGEYDPTTEEVVVNVSTPLDPDDAFPSD